MPVHFKDKLIQDDPDPGLMDDYEGPSVGIFFWLAIMVFLLTIVGFIVVHLYGSFLS